MTDYDIIATMKAFGGGFVKALAEAWYHADEINRAKLKAAFPEYWKEYAEMVKLAQKRQS